MKRQSFVTTASRSESVRRRWESLGEQHAESLRTDNDSQRHVTASDESLFGGSTILEDALWREMIATRLCTST